MWFIFTFLQICSKTRFLSLLRESETVNCSNLILANFWSGAYFYCWLWIVYINWAYIVPNRHLLINSQQWKQQDNVWNILKVKNKETRTTLTSKFQLLTYQPGMLFLISGVFIVNFEHILHILQIFQSLTFSK